MAGRVVHFELPVDDLKRASAFYVEAFGWDLTPMPEMNYTVASTTPTDEQGMPNDPGAINGGITAREGANQAPVITIEVDDMEATLKHVEDLGGTTVTGKTAVGDMGFAGYFKDTEGNVVGLWETAPRT